MKENHSIFMESQTLKARIYFLKNTSQKTSLYILYMVFPFFKWIASHINLIGWLK